MLLTRFRLTPSGFFSVRSRRALSVSTSAPVIWSKHLDPIAGKRWFLRMLSFAACSLGLLFVVAYVAMNVVAKSANVGTDMKTDITLRRPGHAVVLETKCYADALHIGQFGGATLRSPDVYQLGECAALRSARRRQDPPGRRARPRRR